MRIIKKWITVAIALTLSLQLWAANSKRTVTQVTATVELTDDVDYTVTNATPFGNDGIVNIVNTEHAVVILEKVKPSKAIPMLAAHVQINGAKAVNNSNCQVKIYNRGCIILPYGSNFKPLTVYSEKSYKGDSTNNFNLGNDGGFMNTLTEAQLNNRIRSFKLKRGYMVTFSIKAKGRGYSRCFIAADKDVEMATMPAILDRSISSYRIFKWYDTGKPALANDTRESVVDILNVTSCYSFGLGESRLPDAECVPHHIYEDWPSAAACGAVNYSPHMKTNNEPGNSADDHPQSVETILNNWENLMATGMRLCSPSSHDGSLNHLREFLSAVDERGWRCDIIDLHCYWTEGSFYNNIKGWVDSYQRPIWISEWVWGASWNNNGIFGEAQGKYRDNPTQAQLNKNRDIVSNICNALNGYDYIERYYYWNSEANCSKLYYDNKLTPAGEMYAKLDGGLAYKGKVNYVPKAPPQVAPANLGIEYDAEKDTAILTWKETNGEMNEYIYIQYRENSSKAWTKVKEVDFQEDTDSYSDTVEAKQGWEFRILEKNANGATQTSNTVMVVNNSIKPGDAVSVGDKTLYIGGNIVVNSSFDMGLYGWTNGNGEPLAQPWFQTPAIGGADGGSYLQCYGSTGMNTEQAVKTAIKIEPNADYYFMADACNMTTGSIASVILSTDGTKINGGRAVTLSNTAEAWLSSFKAFNSGSNEYAIISFYTLGAKARFDNIRLYRLFDTRDEAYADAADKERQRAQAIMEYEPGIAQAMTEGLTAVQEDKKADYEYIKSLNDDAVEASAVLPLLKYRTAMAKAIISEYPIIGSEEIGSIVNEIDNTLESGKVAPSWVLMQYDALNDKLDQSLTTTVLDGKVKSPDFTTATGWNTKAGTYTGGDQRTAEQDGVTCWNAWWNITPAEAADKTMAINQGIANLQQHGLYFAECKASTQHYCLSDQHAFIVNGEQRAVSPTLSQDYLDLTNISVEDRWEALTTMPVYVDYNEGVTIGFEGSKDGATDLAYRQVGASNNAGDHREGWWCATDFKLRMMPFYRTSVKAGEWQTACLPYSVAATPKMKFYQIAGILSDFSALCLEEIQEVEAGEPFLYLSEENTANFREYGEAVKTANSYGKGNLRGFFTTTGRVPVGAYSIVDGQFMKCTGDRPSIGNYHAFLRSFTDTDKNIKPYTIYDDWSGATIPIIGITDEEKEKLATAGINLIEYSRSQHSQLYTPSGISVRQGAIRPGIYIRVENGKRTKIVIR